MSELSHNKDNNPILDLAQVLAELGLGIIRQRDFIGRKVAQEFMDELGLSGTLDEEGDTAFADMLGVCATSGIVLGMKKTTDETSIQEEVERLQDSLPPPLRPSIGRLAPMFVSRGVEFHRDELSQNSPRVQEWAREYELLSSSIPE